MALNVSLIDTHSQLSALKPEWDSLAGDNPFLSWDWAETWWRYYQTPQTRLFILAVRDEADRLVGLAPWKLRQTLSRGRVVHFIGSNEVCGDRFTILAQADRRANVLHALSQWLVGDARDLWDLLELTGVEQANANIAEFTKMFGEHGNQTHIRQDVNCWKIPLVGNWEQYLTTLSRSRRNRTRRLLKRTIDAGGAIQREVKSPADFDQGFNILVNLHQKRRNMLGEPGCFASERYYAFHLEFARRMLDQGKLRLTWVEMNGVPAAVEYSFLSDKTIYNYQSGFEPTLADAHPGWLNLVVTLRWAIGAGYEAFDMLRGDESYKSSFGAEPSPLAQVRIVGTHNSAKIRHAAWRTQATVKSWAREGMKIASDYRRCGSKAVNENTEVAESGKES